MNLLPPPLLAGAGAQGDLESWLQRLEEEDRDRESEAPLHPAVERLRQLVESDATVRRAFVQPGTYFSEADTEGKKSLKPPESRGYLAHMATRAVILIDADNSAIGLIAVVR